MVLETTEYRKNFRWNSPQNRHQIWEENWNFRKSRKFLEFQHEPFDLWNGEQSSHSSTDDIANEFLPPSKLKQKYLDLIKETTNYPKINTIDRATSPEDYPTSFEHEPQISKSLCDIGVQTPNWDNFKEEHVKFSDKKIQIENDLLEISRKLKEGVICNMNTLDFIKQIIEREKPVSFPMKKFRIKDKHYQPSRNKHSFHQLKSSVNLYSWPNKNNEVTEKQIYNIKTSKSVHSSMLKNQKKKAFESSVFPKKKIPEGREISYKREGHRVINDLKNYVESATKWLDEYDNRYQYRLCSNKV